MSVWEVVYNWDQDGELAQNVLHYQDASPASINWQQFVDQIITDMTVAYTNIIAPAVSFQSITVREDVPGSVGQTYTPTAGPKAGTAVNNQFAHVLSGIIQKRANSSVRPNLGRIYQPGITSESLNADGEWTAGTLTALDTFWEDQVQVSIITGGNFDLVIKASNPLAPNTVAYNPVAAMVPLANPGTQRRRRIGSGV